MTIPSHIGQYRIIRKIGAGGMGMVFLGEHMLLGRRAAIKTLLPTVAVNHEIVERFFNEARATSAISDPGVIQIFDFGYHVDGTAYIVMELLEGEALSARIDRLGRLGLAEALRIARQIAGSLAAAHARGIVHRDLKPENIFLVCDAEAQGGERTKILDFGICKVGGQDGDVTVTQSGAMIGTPVYMSPEQCRGAGGVDHRADIYAFGCLLFHMLTGRPPFEADAPGELIVAHLQTDPVTASSHVAELPPEIDSLLLRCLAKSPDERYQSMTELQLMVGELYAQLGGSDLAVPVVRPSMLLGRGFRSMYDANHAALGGGSPTGTPATGRLRPHWYRSTPSKSSSSDYAGELDDDLDLDLLPPRRHGVRIALACVALVGLVIALVATSFATYRDRDEDGKDREAIRQPALPVESEAPQAAVGTRQEIAPIENPGHQGASSATAAAMVQKAVDDMRANTAPDVASKAAAADVASRAPDAAATVPAYVLPKAAAAEPDVGAKVTPDLAKASDVPPVVVPAVATTTADAEPKAGPDIRKPTDGERKTAPDMRKPTHDEPRAAPDVTNRTADAEPKTARDVTRAATDDELKAAPDPKKTADAEQKATSKATAGSARSPRETKKPTARPRPRPVVVTPRPPSATTEDLYDSR